MCGVKHPLTERTRAHARKRRIAVRPACACLEVEGFVLPSLSSVCVCVFYSNMLLFGAKSESEARQGLVCIHPHRECIATTTSSSDWGTIGRQDKTCYPRPASRCTRMFPRQGVEAAVDVRFREMLGALLERATHGENRSWAREQSFFGG